jgi:guanylate kinase
MLALNISSCLISLTTLLSFLFLITPSFGFAPPSPISLSTRHCSSLRLSYVTPEQESSTPTKKPKSLHPQIGDLVRYYDLDGGNQQGQELVGKITFLTSVASQGFLAELTELEDVGDGYYAEYSSQKRMSKKMDRNLNYVSPIMASYVRAEQAFKVPLTSEGSLRVRQETYDIDDYGGPVFKIDNAIVQKDGINYETLKFNLLKNAAITGLAGSVVANILKGPEIASIYFAGALASVGYLYFLSVKTDTLASEDAKLGKNVANVRFLMPVFVIVGVALYNQSRGDLNPLKDTDSMFDTVTAEQFGAVFLGFLTYRLPLFLSQIRDAFKEDENDELSSILPGSAGVVMQLATGAKTDATSTSIADQSLTPVLLVSGPQSTGRSELVQQLLEEDERLVAPTLIDRMQDGVTFERLEERGEFLKVDHTGRFGLTKDAILQAAQVKPEGGGFDMVVVVDADVALAKQLQSLSGARLIGVWVGLNSVTEFEERLEADMEAGKVAIPEDETKESFLRSKVREIVNEIEFGLGSGIFEFTVLNDGTKKSLRELQEAAEYCFK